MDLKYVILLSGALSSMVHSLRVFDVCIGEDVEFSLENTAILNTYSIRKSSIPRSYSFKEYFAPHDRIVRVTLKNVGPKDGGIYWVSDEFRNLYKFELKMTSGYCYGGLTMNGTDVIHKIQCVTCKNIHYDWVCNDLKLIDDNGIYNMTRMDFTNSNMHMYELLVSDGALSDDVERTCKMISSDGNFITNFIIIKRLMM